MTKGVYREGTWFAIPLRDGGFGVGVAARVSRRGGVLGYFFGPRRLTVPSLAEVEGLTSDQAILVELFGDLGLIQGRWPIIGRAPSWDRQRWPMPVFGRFEDLTGRAFRVEYDEDNLPAIVREVPASREEVERLPKDGVSGAGFLEKVLTKLLPSTY